MFITLEGPEGSGKTSQIPRLADALRAAGHQVLTTREPGGTPIGDQIRKVLFDLGNKTMQPRSEILLFQASRAQLVDEVIRPALADGQVVLCDRYADSTMAYQGYGHEMDLAQLAELVRFATGGLKPDLTVFLDIKPQDGLRRRDADGNWNRLDDYKLEFHERVYAGYKALIAAEPQRWEVVDAARTPDEVAANLAQVVLDRLKSK
ncbi:MAG: dTMP kinase [Anaerolineales bacterium]|nr:dTMP kinase [Anaerolineales bacterium]